MKTALLLLLLLGPAKSSSAEETPRFGHCEILTSGRSDAISRRCWDGFGVLYFGYLIDSWCHRKLATTINIMKGTAACEKEPVRGACSILFPGKETITKDSCDTGYGVVYDGEILYNQCFDGVEEAFKFMEEYDYPCKPGGLHATQPSP